MLTRLERAHVQRTIERRCRLCCQNELDIAPEERAVGPRCVGQEAEIAVAVVAVVPEELLPHATGARLRNARSDTARMRREDLDT
jgi:hypothetical protein